MSRGESFHRSDILVPKASTWVDPCHKQPTQDSDKEDGEDGPGLACVYMYKVGCKMGFAVFECGNEVFLKAYLEVLLLEIKGCGIFTY